MFVFQLTKRIHRRILKTSLLGDGVGAFLVGFLLPQVPGTVPPGTEGVRWQYQRQAARWKGGASWEEFLHPLFSQIGNVSFCNIEF